MTHLTITPVVIDSRLEAKTTVFQNFSSVHLIERELVPGLELLITINRAPLPVSVELQKITDHRLAPLSAFLEALSTIVKS